MSEPDVSYLAAASATCCTVDSNAWISSQKSRAWAVLFVQRSPGTSLELDSASWWEMSHLKGWRKGTRAGGRRQGLEEGDEGWHMCTGLEPLVLLPFHLLSPQIVQ